MSLTMVTIPNEKLIIEPEPPDLGEIYFSSTSCTSLFRSLKKYPFEIGYVVAVLARGALHSLGGYLYWMDYMPENFPVKLASLYPVIYNYSYILVEMILTLIVINLPPVKKALQRMETLAVES